MTAACCHTGSSSSPSMRRWTSPSSTRVGATVFFREAGVAGFVAAAGCCAAALRQRINVAPSSAARTAVVSILRIGPHAGHSLQQGESRMKRVSYVLLLAFFVLPALVLKSPAQQQPKQDQWTPAEQAMGRSGERQPD